MNESDELNCEKHDAFDEFLMKMDDQLVNFFSEAQSVGINLDMSISSVGSLENLFNSLEKLGHDFDDTVISIARYLGEVLRIHSEGQWKLALENPKDAYFNLPVIEGHRSSGVMFSPISVMRSYGLRKKQGTVWAAFENHIIEPKPLNLDNLVEK